MPLNSSKTNTTIETVTKITASIGGIFYFLGFLISLIHYGQFGILAIDFFSTKYILIGGLCFAYIMCMVFGIYLMNQLRIKTKNKSTIVTAKYKSLASYLVYGIGMFIFIIIFQLILDILSCFQNISGNDNHSWKIYFGVSLGVSIIYVLMFMLRVISLNELTPTPKIETNNTDFFTLNGMVFLSVVFIFSYTYCIYPQIPTALAGGQVSKISLILKEDRSNMYFRKMLCGTDSLNNHTKTVSLIMETCNTPLF